MPVAFEIQPKEDVQDSNLKVERRKGDVSSFKIILISEKISGSDLSNSDSNEEFQFISEMNILSQ